MKQKACQLTLESMLHRAHHVIFLVFGLCWLVVASLQPLYASSDSAVIRQGPLVEQKPQPANAVERIRKASQEVYRMLVDIDGAIKGGTAFFVSGKRMIATSQHVIEGGTSFSLGHIDAAGHPKRMSLRLIAIYPQKDLALLEAAEELPGQPLSLAAQAPLPGSDLYAIGFPAAADLQRLPRGSDSEDETFFLPSVLKGTVSRILTNRWLTSQLQHQTPIVPGYSGGPLVDSEGVVVGISSSVHKEANGISYGVLAADLADFIQASMAPVESNVPEPRPATERPSNPAVPSNDTANADPPTRPALTADDLATLNRAEGLLHDGDIAAAQMICQHLVNSTRSPEAFRCLGKTYDPEVLRERRVIGITGNPDLAQFCYHQASKALLVPQQTPAVPQKIAPLLPPKSSDVRVCKLVVRANQPIVACDRVYRN